jgi:hypothetical protein
MVPVDVEPGCGGGVVKDLGDLRSRITRNKASQPGPEDHDVLVRMCMEYWFVYARYIPSGHVHDLAMLSRGVKITKKKSVPPLIKVRGVEAAPPAPRARG